MNKHAYKLVFNQKRGMLVAVSEVAVNHSKEPNSGQTQGSSGHTSGTAQRIKHGMVMLLMAFQIWQPLLAAPVAITPDNTQAGSKPTVTAANNGVPVVNIIAPNTQGVSINQFKEYNVPKIGLILNNSGGTSQTQLGGYIQGNPMLGNRAASTIVNQVNGPNRSLILGAQEIAGQRANLILANQNGVSINGGSFINTANVTLTTGAPQYNNGALAGYAVKDGLIDVGAGGLDASTTDKLTILTRAAQINGQIWAKQAELITGQNQISFDAQGKHQATANPSGANTTPSYALDVSAVGGMYAGQMRIIGTEQGLGVNNAGQLVSAGELSLDAQGNLINSGHIDGGGNTDIRVLSTDNSGQISAVNNLTFNNATNLNNSGTITAGSVQIDASSLVNTGTLNQTGVQGMEITAQNLNNQGTLGIVADATAPTIDPSTGQAHINNSTAPATSTGETSNSAGQITTNPVVLNDGHIHVTQDLTNQGKLLTAGTLTVNVLDTLSNTGAIRTADALSLKAQQIDNQTAATIASQTSATLNATQLNNQGQLQAQTLTATANNIDNSQGSITGEQSLTLNADGSIKNAQGNIQSEQLTLNTPNLNNAQGTINAGAGDLSLANANLNNQQGAIYANNLTLTNQSINNQGGQLIARQALKAGNATTTQIDNTAGLIASQNSTTQVQASRILNDQGLIQGTDTQVIANTLSNTDSGDYGILGTQAVTVKADSIDNTSGRIAGHSVTLNGNSTPASNTLINTAGQISADSTLNVNAQTLSNTKGVINADTASLTIQQLDNSQGQIYAQTQLSTDSDSLTNTAGQLVSNGSANVSATNINNTDNGLIQAQNLTVTADTIDNSRNKPTVDNIGGGIIGVDSLTLDAQTLTNDTGYVAGGTLNLNNNTPTATIDNTHGLIATNSDLTFNQTELNNQQGGISAKNLTLNNTTLNNQGGQLLASENLTANAETLNNQGGTVAASQTASITGTTVNNQAGLIQGHKTTIDAASLDNSNTLDAGGIIAEQALSVQLTQTLNNQSGNIAGDSVQANVANIDNGQGAIQANGALKLTATKFIDNSAGTIASAGAVNLSSATLTNAQKGYIASKTQVGIQAGGIINQTGVIVSDQTVKLSGDTLNNQQGQIQGKDLTVNVTNIDNSNTATTGGLTGTASLNLTATSLTNHAGYVAGQQAILNSDTIDNSQKGVMVGVDSLSLTGQTLNNQTGQISATGDIDVQEGRVDNSAGLISTQANLTMGSGGALTHLTNSAGQILAGQSTDIHATDVLNDAGLIRAKDLTVHADSITNTHSGTTGGMVGDSQLTLNTQGALNNTAGYIAGDTTQIDSATLDNSTGTITGLNQLSIETGKLTNAQGNIASNVQATVISSELANTQGHIGASALTVNTGTLNNSQGEVIGSTTANLTATDINNTGGWLQSKALTINTNTLDNGLAGIVLGNQTLDITANSSIDNAGTIQAGDEAQKGTAHLSTATLGNTGSIHADTLTLDGTDLNNNAGQLTATENLTVNADTLSNQAGLVSANGTVQLNVGALDNSQTLNPNNTALGIQADTVNIVGQSIHNDTGSIVGNTVTTQGDSLNNSHGLVSGNTVKVTAPSLTNTAGTLTADDLTLTTHNYTNQGTIQGNNSTTLNLSGDFSNQGVLSSAGSLVIHTDGNITNTTGSTLSANNTLDLAGQNITNQTDATMSASHTLLNATDTITNDGTIDGNLTELRAGNQIINNHKIYGGDFEGNGGIVIGTGNLINNANAVIASRADMAIGAVSITNEVGGLIQSQGDMTIGRTLGSAADGYAVTGMADRLDNKSATIEVGGSAQWDIANIQNSNTQFAWSTVDSAPIHQVTYKINGIDYDRSQIRLYVNKQFYDASTPQATMGDEEDFQLVMPSATYPFETFGPFVGSNPFPYGKTASSSGFTFNRVPKLAQAYTPSGEICKTTGTKDNRTTECSTVFENFVYKPSDPVWTVFGIQAPDSTKPEVPVPPRDPGLFGLGTFSFCTSPSGSWVQKCATYKTDLENYKLAAAQYQVDDQNWRNRNFNQYLALNDAINAFNTDLAARITAHEFDYLEDDQVTHTPVVTKSSPAKIIIGQDAQLNGHILNDKSQIIVGGTLSGTAQSVENQGAEAQKSTTFENVSMIYTHPQDRGGWFSGTGRAYDSIPNPQIAPIIETVNLSIAEVKTNVGAQAVANAAGNNNLGVNAVNLAIQTATSSNNQTSKDLSTSNLNGSNTATGGSLNAQGSANTSDPLAGNTNPATGTDIQSQEHNPTNSPVSTVATGNGQEIRTVAFNGILPSNVLFNVANDPNANYIVETDPQYTNKKQFLSSNYLLEQYDPTHTFKRIGDGYYEQKLITDQIITATGKRYVGDYSSNEVQYKALMDSGLTIGKAFNLTVGTALTAEQMSQLTTDIIWMVEETVTLADGTKVKALVPRVYLTSNRLDLKGDGTLIASKNNFLNVTGDVNNNGGTIAAFKTMNLTANTINNTGGTMGGNTGSNIVLHTQGNLNNIGGSLRGGNLALDVGGNLNSITTTYHTQTGDMNLKDRRNYASVRDGIDQVASIQALDGNHRFKDAQGNTHSQTALNIQTQGDINLKASSVSSAGDAYTSAQNINLTTVDTGFAENAVYNWSKKNKHRTERSDTAEVGTILTAAGDNTLVADHDINAKAAVVNSDTGTLTAVAGNDINITNGTATHADSSYTYKKRSGFLSSSSTTDSVSNHSTTATGAEFTGAQVILDAGHDANITGSSVVSDNLTSVHADNDINILNATDTQGGTQFHETKKSGLMGTGGFGFMIGSKQNSTDADHTNTSNVASNVGSLNGNVNLSAGNHYQQTGSNVTAGHADATGQFVSAGDVTITAKDVDIVAGQDTYANNTVTKSKQSGLTVAVSVPIVNAVMAVADTAQTVGQSKNSRVNAMSAANTAMAGYQAGKALSDLAKSGMDSVKDLNVSVSITVGSSQSKSETHAKGTEAVASNVVGNNVTITATGADKDSNIHVIGSEIAGTQATTLKADNNVTLESAQSTSEEHSSNKSSGWNAGVAIGTQGIGFTFGGNYGKGHGDGTSVTQVNSHVGSSTGTTTIVAGDTTTLAGAQVLGNQVNIDTQNLAIESRQDTAKYDSKQMDMSGQVTVGYGFSASGSYSQSKINADYASVNEQSGIMAEDGGYNVNVKDHTDLKGGIITSTQAAEDAGRNQMSTGTLTASNIQNHADYDASGFGISGGVELGKAGSGGQDKDTGKNLGVGADNRSLGVNKSLGYGADDGHNASTTVSGINTANLTIINTAGQAQLMGKPADTPDAVIANAVKQSIATTTTTDQVQANSGAITNNFDKDAVQSEIDLQIKVTQQFDTTRQQAKTIVNTKLEALNKDIKALEDAKTAGTMTADQDKLLTEKLAERDNWQIGGTIIDSIASGLSGPTSTGAAGILANAAAPQLQYQIGQYFKGTDAEGSTAHVIAHTILAAAVAATGGNDALLAGVSAGGAELIAPAVANWLYGSNPDVKKDANGNVIASELTAEQKNTISNIIGLGTAGATGLAGGSVTDVVSSTGLTQTAVEENGLSGKEKVDFEKNFATFCVFGKTAGDKGNCEVMLEHYYDYTFSNQDPKNVLSKEEWDAIYLESLRNFENEFCGGSYGTQSACMEGAKNLATMLYIENGGYAPRDVDRTLYYASKEFEAKYKDIVNEYEYNRVKNLVDATGIFLPPFAVLSTAITVVEIGNDIKSGNFASSAYGIGQLGITNAVEKTLEKKILFFKYLPKSQRDTIIYNTVKLVIDRAGDAANPYKN